MSELRLNTVTDKDTDKGVNVDALHYQNTQLVRNLGTWQPGLVFENKTDYATYNNQAIIPNEDTTLPYTTQGSDPTVAPDVGLVVPFAEVASSDVTSVFNTLTDLKSAIVFVGQSVRTLGYYEAGDGGGADYTVVAGGTGTEDGGSFVNLFSPLNLQLRRVLNHKGHVNVESFGAVGDAVADNTNAINNASLYVSSIGGGTLHYGAGVFKARKIPHRSNVVHSGASMTASALIAMDNSILDSNSSIGSFIYKPDDGSRVFRAGYNNLYIGSSLTGVSAAEDVFSSVCGLNLVACERTRLDNLQFGGFGQGAIIMARAEGGAEGLGMLNTTQDGNYNTATSIHIASCGSYNEDESAVWFKYKANSNNFYGLHSKPVSVAVGIPHGNDNLICGLTTESSKSIAVLGPNGMGNTFIQPRAEILSADGFLFKSGSIKNTVLGGWITGVSGEEFNLTDAPRQTIIGSSIKYMGGDAFPPTTSVSVNHKTDNSTFRAIVGDNNAPLFVKAKEYNVGNYPVQQFWNSQVASNTGDTIFEIQGSSNDASSGASGVSCSIKGVFEGTAGQSALAFSTGNGSTMTERFRVDNRGNLHPSSDNAYTLGEAANRWSEVFSATGTINTSDGNQKQDVVDVNAAELEAAKALKGMIKRFRYKDAVERKGDKARYHFGVIAQEVEQVFSDNGLNAEEYGIFCSDTWYEKEVVFYERKETRFVIYNDDEPIFVDEDTEGAKEVLIPVRYDNEVEGSEKVIRNVNFNEPEEGAQEITRLGIRYDELLAFIISAI